MSFQMVNDSEMGQLVDTIHYAKRNRAILRYVQDIWGDQTYNILIQPDNSNSGCSIKHIEVTNRSAEEFLPDFSLPFWQEVLEQDPEFTTGYKTFGLLLERVMEYLEDERDIYEEYDIDVPYSEDLIVLSELGATQYPELYRKV